MTEWEEDKLVSFVVHYVRKHCDPKASELSKARELLRCAQILTLVAAGLIEDEARGECD